MTRHPLTSRIRALPVSPLGLALTATGFALATVTRADADLWGHLRFGLDMLRDRELTLVDPYSFTQDKPWVNHEWLSELIMAAAYRLGGVTGLVAHKAALLTVVFAVVWRGLGAASPVAKLWVMLGLAFGTIHMTSSIRPQLWTFLGLAILCRVLVRDVAAGRWALPPLFLVWVNCHGGWIVGLGVLGAWVAVDIVLRPARLRQWAGPVSATLLATIVNPYGWHIWLFMVETVRMTRNVTEWGPLWGTPVLNWIPWMAGAAAIPWYVRRARDRRWHVALVLTMLAYASARVMRIESLFVLAAATLLAPAIADRWPRDASPLGAVASRYRHVAAAALVVLTGAATVRSEFRSSSCIGVWGTGAPDVAVMRSLEHAGAGRIVTYFDWGQYALWHLAPRLRVSMDGRRETVYSDARLAEHDAILRGSDDGRRTLARWRAEYVWLPTGSATTRSWLVGNGYRIDVETPRSFVAVRSDLPMLPPPADPVQRPCFPG